MGGKANRPRQAADRSEDSAMAAGKRARGGGESESEGEGEREGIAQRLGRRSKQRVLFADVMAQAREMEALARDRRASGAKAAAAAPAAPKSSKKSRAEERRNQRQALRRAMSPRSPDNRGQKPPTAALRGGVALVDLTDDEDASPGKRAKKRRFASNEDAIQDAHLHSTAWRHVRFGAPPVNVLPDRDGVRPPFARDMDRPLGFYDPELAAMCALHPDAPVVLTASAGSVGEARQNAKLEDRVTQLVEEVTPLIKNCHNMRAKETIANARAQVAAYLADLPEFRERTIRELGNTVPSPLPVSRLEKVAAHRLLRNDEYAVNAVDAAPFGYRFGRGDNTLTGRLIEIEDITYLSVLPALRKSTTCILTRGTHRVDDDPIMRYVPLFTMKANEQSKINIAHFDGFAGPRKETLIGCDDESNEYVLRFVNTQCGGSPEALEILKRLGYSEQPLADLADIKRRLMRENLLCEESSESGNSSIQTTMNESIRRRLEQPPRNLVVNRSSSSNSSDLGLRQFTDASPAFADTEESLSASYWELFCRRCFAYNCRNHGIRQPRPIMRADPKYPVVKATAKLAGLAVTEDAIPNDHIDDVTATPQTVETMEVIEKIDSTNVKQEHEGDDESPNEPDLIDLESPQIRRSARSQTAASTKASTMLQSQRPFERKKASQPRGRLDPESDASEFLGLERYYRTLTGDERLRLLSESGKCGQDCSKNATLSLNGSESVIDTEWQVAEVILLDKLMVMLGNSPCAIARVLATKSCGEVAEFIRRNQSDRERSSRANMFAKLRADRGRERSLGVAGNSYDHLRRTRHQRMRDRGANHEYVPCDHVGASCNSAGCSCMRRDHFCDKACSCTRDCANRFPGCRCAPGQCRTDACPCFFALRECDPDVCGSCGACEVPVLLANGSTVTSAQESKLCGNVNILRGKFKRIAIAPSETHGWGAFAREAISQGSFIYEYTGSLLSQDEAERRGNVYDKSTVSFLFDLNEDSVVDATRKGNKSKFANHDSKEPKCFARIMLVGGEHRIGIYAKANIAAGDELFFNYGYNGVIPDWSQARIAGEKPTSNGTIGDPILPAPTSSPVIVEVSDSDSPATA